MNQLWMLLIPLWLFVACNTPTKNPSQRVHPSSNIEDDLTPKDSVMLSTEEGQIETEEDTVSENQSPLFQELESALQAQGLLDVGAYIPTVQVEMKYSTSDNFLGEDVYGAYNKCYLQPEVTKRLGKADSILRSVYPDLRLLVYDCVRPRRVQYQMWEIVKGTPQQSYVAAPGGTGSMHNYGAAVDLTLVHVDTGELDMGTAFDFFGQLAQPRHEDGYLKTGKLTKSQVANRRILRAAMKKAGFYGIQSEWWHFVGLPREVVRTQYQIVE